MRTVDQPVVDVIVLIWNDEEKGRIAVESALRSEGVAPRVVVVDNGSDPAVGPFDDPRVQVIRSDVNLGVAPGRARGIDSGDADYVCLLDSDACLHPDSLRTMVGTLADDATIGLAAPVFDGQDPRESAGPAPTAATKLRRAFTGSAMYDGSAFASDSDVLREVDFAIGACQVFKRSAYRAVGGLDTTIFYGPEDVDFCLRLREAGWRVVQVRAAQCDHPPRRNRRNLSRAGIRHAVQIARHLAKHRSYEPAPSRPPVRRYDLHGIVSVVVDERVHGIDVIEQILGSFRSGAENPRDGGSGHRIEIYQGVGFAAREGDVDLMQGHAGPGFEYGDSWFTFQDGTVLVAGDATSLVIGAERNVDRALMPLIDWVASSSDACMVHSAAVSRGGNAALISGWGGVGKTATLAKLCRSGGADFIADDMLLVGADGSAYSLPKPMYIYPYHEPLFPELFEEPHKTLVPLALTPAASKVKFALRPFVELFPALENKARAVTPEHMKTPPEKAMPGLSIATRAKVGTIVRLERYRGSTVRVSAMDEGELVDGMVAEFFGEAIATTGVGFALAGASSSVMPLDRWMTIRRRVLEALAQSAEAIRVELPYEVSAEDASETVSSLVADAIS